MKIILVTSQITYIPNNCLDFLSEVMSKNSKHIVGLVLINNLPFDLLPKTLWLYGMGCTNFANTLIRNTYELLFGKRERLFRKNNRAVFKVNSMNDPKMIDWVKENEIDLIINLRTRCIYKKEILNTPKFGCINIHHGLLPKYRGIFGDLYALYENRPAGISIHIMSEKIDDGQILYTKVISNNREKNYRKYLSANGHEEANLVTKLLNHIEQYGDVPKGRENKSAQPIYTKTPNKYDIRKMQKGGMIL